MGRGGTNSLWSSGMTCRFPGAQRFAPLRRQATQTGRSIWSCLLQQRLAAAINDPVMQGCEVSRRTCTAHSVHHNRQGYRDKPHGQLVLVSLTHYCASTPSLSTSWSRTTLQQAQGLGKSHLKASFPLRCFQRLSLPNLATRQCHWRDNRYTRGSSTPVLSY